MISKVRYGNRTNKVKDMTLEQVAANTGHMVNYLAYDKYLGPVLVHVGFGSQNHAETVKSIFAQQFGASAQLTKIQQIVG